MSGKSSFELTSEANRSLVTGSGELTLYVAPEFKRLLGDAVSSGKEVTVDLTGANYIDSAILMALLAPGKAMHRDGRKLEVVVSEGGQPQRMIKICKMDILLDVVAR